MYMYVYMDVYMDVYIGVALWALFCQGLLLDADGGTGRSMEAVRCLVCTVLCAVLLGYGAGKISLDDVLGLDPQYRVSFFLFFFS
jgi:hypothetical protein